MAFDLKKVVIIDFETTGLRSDSDRIIEVGAVALDGKKIVSKFSQLMNPGDFLPANIIQITGITDEMLWDKPMPEEVLPQLLDFISDRVIIAHNAGFDQKFLSSEASRVNREVDNPVLCTLKLARRLMPGMPNYRLETLKDYLGVRVSRSHRALDDAEATSFLWRHLYETSCKMAESNSVELDFLQEIEKANTRKINDHIYENSYF